MRKLFIPVIAAVIVTAFYIISGAPAAGDSGHYYGAPNSIGSDDDANDRYHYELKVLRDPATGMIPAGVRERELAFAATLPGDRNLPAGRTTSLGWDPRGPWNVGGKTRAVGIDVSNENNILAGTTSGGMWRSTDGGLTWRQTLPASQLKSVASVAQDTRPGHTNVWYYTTGEAYGASASAAGAYYYGDGIYKSTDSGKTWTMLLSTKSTAATTLNSWSQITWNIVTDPSDMTRDVVYVAAYAGIYRSIDGGATWTRVLGTFGTASDAYFTDVAITGSGVVYATLSSGSSTGGIYRSTDGVTFTNITPASFPATFRRVKIGISPSHEEQVYFLGNTPGFGYADTSVSGTPDWNSLWRYTYLSGDGSGTGGRWNDRSLNLPSAGGRFDKFSSQGGYDLVVKVKPNDTNVVFVGGTNLYRSTSGFADSMHTTFIGGYNKGATFPVIGNYLNHHPDQHDLVFFRNPNKMISANDGGVFYSNDNTVPSLLWTSLNNGYITTMFYTCAIDHASANDIVVGGTQDNGTWFTNSSSLTHPWVTPRGGDGSYCAIADRGSAYYFSIQNGKMMKAKVNNSGKVDSFARIDPIGGRGYQFINPFVMDPNNNNIMYLAGGRVLWRNNDLSGIPYAGNWDSISTNWMKFPESFSAGGEITAVTVSKKPANRVYYGSESRRVLRIDSAHIGARTPRNITGTAFPTGANVSCIAVDPENADNVMVTFSNYNVYSIFYTSDGGTTWQKVAGNLEVSKSTGAGDGPSVRWAKIIPVSGGTVYLAGTSVGLFATTRLNDTNTVWVQQGTNTIGNAIVDMIDYRETDGLVVVATHSNGIFSSHITQAGDITSVEEATAAATGYRFTNYPNPFGSETTIEFDLPRQSNVTLVVLDNMGRTVSNIVAGDALQAGKHKYQFPAASLPSGMYYCTLRAGTYTETRKLLIMR